MKSLQSTSFKEISGVQRLIGVVFDLPWPDIVLATLRFVCEELRAPSGVANFGEFPLYT